MSVAIDAEAGAKIELLRQQFAQRMRGDAAFVQSVLDAQGARAATEAEIVALRKICHSLTGAAGIFGYAPVAEAASRMSAAFASGERDLAGLATLARTLAGTIETALANP